MKSYFKRGLVTIFGGIMLIISVISMPVTVSATERFNGPGETHPISYSITYDSREVYEVHTNGGVPIYTDPMPNNSCAVVAGSTLVGYYDYYCTNLMPGFDSWYVFNNRLYYKMTSPNSIAVINELYGLMKTNVGGAGTTEANFLNGLKLYVEARGYNLGYSTVKQSSNFNVGLFEQSVSANKPVALLLSGYIYFPDGNYYTNNKTDTFSGVNSGNNHIAIAYGYTQYKYYRNGSLFRTDNYLMIAFGDDTAGLLYINNSSNINNAYSMIIS